MNTIEQQILEKVSHLEIEKQKRVLEFVEKLTAPVAQYTAVELMQMPVATRNAILCAQLELLADEDFETIEAYAEEDLDATI